VIEGFHGVRYDKPRSRTLDVIDVVRQVTAREVVTYDGPTTQIPLPPGAGGTGLGKPLKLIDHPVRPVVPIWWAAMLDRGVESAAVPRELLERMHLVGPALHVAERIEAFRQAGVTTLLVEPVGADPVATIAQLRELL
jgi:hypothetical protein